MSPTNLTCAVCLFPNVCPTDYQGPIELLSFISPNLLDVYPWLQNTPHTLTVDYFAVTADPVHGSSGPGFTPTRSYDDVQSGEQYDVILVPGGPGSRPGKTPDAVIQFVKAQAPKAKYVLSTCTGAELLARAGVLAGKNATTNKTQYGRIKKENPGVNWIPRGRWVVDGNVWTSAGVFAGVDMAYAFLSALVGDDIAQKIRVIVEFSNHAREDDEFAEPEPFE